MDVATVVTTATGIDAGLGARLSFLLELDKLKAVQRRSLLIDRTRYENTAEHSWHLAMFAMVLAPHAGPEVDIGRAVEMLLVHDLVEIDAGDTYIYDAAGAADKEERERQAADRIFGLLPDPEGKRMRQLWEEYEEHSTPTGRFAYAIDRLQPVLLNAGSGGQSWLDNAIRHSQTTEVNAPIAAGSTPLWELVDSVLGQAADEGLLIDDRAPRA